jgi:hypothetical protein
MPPPPWVDGGVCVCGGWGVLVAAPGPAANGSHASWELKQALSNHPTHWAHALANWRHLLCASGDHSEAPHPSTVHGHVNLRPRHQS